MQIFKENNKNEKKFFKKRIKKTLLIRLIFSIFFGSIIFTPLDFLNTNTSNKFFTNSRREKIRGYLLSSFNLLDKRAFFLAKESLDYGDSFFNIGWKYFRSAFINEDRLNLNISFKNFQKLRIKRDQAVKEGILIRSIDDKVSASLDYKGKSYPVKIRLKGDWTDHLIGDKWSFRLETRKGKSFLGMNEFSLQHPRTRNYINEQIFHKLLKYENLPYLRYKFLPIAINGRDLGIYALEEHFSKELLENSGFREGPIIKISDQNLREMQRKRMNYDNYLGSQRTVNTVNKYNSEILTFNIDKTLENKSKIAQFKLSKNLLDQLLKREIKTSDVFDVELTARYFALSDLLGAAQASTWYDMRFYFNPISSRLIPIGYDAQFPIRNKQRTLSYDLNVLGLFNDQIFLKEYLKELNRISNPKYLDEFLKKIDSEIKKEISIINKTFPHVKFLKEEFYKNQKYIKNRLNPLDPISLSFAEPVKDQEKIYLKLFNKSLFPLNINYLEYDNRNYYPSVNKILRPRKKFERINHTLMELIYRKSKIENNNKIDKNQVIIKYNLDGINKVFTKKIKVLPWAQTTKNSNELITREPNHYSFPSLIIDNEIKVITLKNNIEVKKPLIFPPNYEISIKPGTKITLKDKGVIIIQGPLIISGTKDKPVTISSEEEGMGIVVLNAKSISNLKHVVFNNLSYPNLASINITGGLTFYNSPVNLSNAKFLKSRAEDALNIIRSNFTIKDSYFENTFSDGIDIDFSEGTIENSQFVNTGNDAIDISGSLVTLNKIKINSAFDKAISIGEGSNVIANDLNISGAFIGIASKDLSSIKIKNSKINTTEICLAAYQKKAEYGPASIKIFETNKLCLPFTFVLEDGSSINTDSQGFKPNTFNAYRKLYPSDQ